MPGPESKEMGTIEQSEQIATLEAKPMVTVHASTSLRVAIQLAHKEQEASFAVEDNGHVTVIEALEMFEQVRQKFHGDAKRQLRAIRALCNSNLPVLEAFKEAGIHPVRIAGSGVEMQTVLAGERLMIESPVERQYGLNGSDPALFRIDEPIANAFSCAWICGSGVHLWACAAGTPPETCENGKPYTLDT
jgi:hypothetical protein